MQWDDLLAAFALYLVLEGLLPFLSPRGWKQSIAQISKISDSQLRKIGFASMIAGVILLAVVRG